MKKKLTIILILAITLTVSCKKDKKNSSVNLSATTYLPVSNGSHWTYKDVLSTYTFTITMQNSTTAFNGKNYYNAIEASNNSINSVTQGYFYTANNTYVSRGLFIDPLLELQLGVDNQPVGYTWIAAPTDNNMYQNNFERTSNTIKEINITKTVSGQTFSNVIHTRIDLQYAYLGSYQSAGMYDVFLAKGVGVIEFDSYFVGDLTQSLLLTNYSIK